MNSHLFVYGTLEPAHAPAEIAAAVRRLRRVSDQDQFGADCTTWESIPERW